MSLTNTQLLVHLCEHSKSGVVTQLVIMEAVLSYVERVASAPEGFLGQAAALVDEGTWRRACKEIAEAHENRGTTPVPASHEAGQAKDLVSDMLSMLQDLHNNYGWDELTCTLEDVQERAHEAFSE